MATKYSTGDSPIITLSLKGYPNLTLNFGRESLSDAAQILIKSHATEPVLLHLNGLRGEDYNFDLIPALQAGLLELIDTKTEERISIPSGNEPVRPKTIIPRSIEEVQTIYFEPQNDFWKDLISPDRDYLIRFSENGGTSKCYSKSSESQTQKSEDDQQTSLLIHRDQSTIPFTVRDDPQPPKLNLNLSATSQICHLTTNTPKFEFIITITSQETRPITVDLRHTPFTMYTGLSDIVSIEDKEFSEEVEMPNSQGCFLDNDGPEDFPQKTIPQEFLPGQSWVQRYSLRHYDKETSNGGELECLDEGTEYEVKLSESIKNSFTSWCYSPENELPTEEKERKKAFEGNGTIRFEISGEPLEFRTEK